MPGQPQFNASTWRRAGNAKGEGEKGKRKSTMPTDTVRIEEFIAQNGIAMRCERTDRNPSMAESDNMDHWKVTLTRTAGPVVDVEYTCRDIGYGVESGKRRGVWGETDTWGKRALIPVAGETIYLFPDEIMGEKRVPRSVHKKHMTLVFSQGYGHKGAEPELASVLDCLASDAAGIENARTFEEWCDEYGYDADSRKAERTYKACVHQASRLKSFLGKDLYSVLLWNTERC